MLWTVRPIIAGEFGMVRDDIKFSGGDPAKSGMVPSYIYLLENGIEQVVVDTSFTQPKRCEEVLGLVVKRNISYKKLLDQNGIVAGKVSAVILTHLHWDHAANLKLFASAKIYCQQKEADFALSPDSGYLPCFLKEYKAAADRWVLVDKDTTVFEGINLFHCGGHTVGSQMVEVNTSEGKVLITGDTIMTYENVIKRIPIGLCSDLEACRLAVEDVRLKQAVLLLPSHDYHTMEYLSNKENCRVCSLTQGS